MRGTVAKRLRKHVYGDQSLRERRIYRHSGSAPLYTGGLVNVGPRRAYQQAKRTYKESRKGKA